MQAITNYLPYVIFVGLYHGQRKRAITALQWQPNTEGGHVDLSNRQIDFRSIERHETNKRRAHAPINPRVLTFYVTFADGPASSYSSVMSTVNENGTKGVTRGPIQDVKKAFANAVAAAGLEDVTIHTLVHTCCTWLMQAGCRSQKPLASSTRPNKSFADLFASSPTHAPRH